MDHHADLRQVIIHGHALMSNHFHLVVMGQVEDGVSRFMQHLSGQYAQYLHGRLNRRGRLWQSRFYSCVLDAHHFLTALAYVDLNPVRSRQLDRAENYAWSSAAAHYGVSPAPDWLDLAALHGRVTPADWRERLQRSQSRADLAALRRATQTECPLGQPGVVEELEAKFGVQFAAAAARSSAEEAGTKRVVAAEIARHAGFTRVVGGGVDRTLPHFGIRASVALSFGQINWFF